jgi:uncharacterized OsmC-like protein
LADYKASIKTENNNPAAIDPRGFSIRHHMAGSAHLEMSKLTGGHVLHAAVGICIFNDTLALAKERSIQIDELRVDVDGGFAGDTYYVSTGISFDIEISSPVSRSEIDSLISAVVDDASVPRSIEQGTAVRLGTVTCRSTTR